MKNSESILQSRIAWQESPLFSIFAVKHTKKMAARQESKKKNSEEEPAKTSVENEKSKGKNEGKKKS